MDFKTSNAFTPKSQEATISWHALEVHALEIHALEVHALQVNLKTFTWKLAKFHSNAPQVCDESQDRILPTEKMISVHNSMNGTSLIIHRYRGTFPGSDESFYGDSRCLVWFAFGFDWIFEWGVCSGCGHARLRSFVGTLPFTKPNAFTGAFEILKVCYSMNLWKFFESLDQWVKQKLPENRAKV